MKTRLLYIMLVLLANGHSALAASTLLGVTRTHTRESTQIYFTFDKPPVHSINLREKRLEISLDDTRPAQGLQFFAADTRIIKILPITNDDRTVISFFFRHKPRDVKTEKSKEGRLILDILVGDQSSLANQVIAKQLKDITVLNEEPTVSTNPLNNSPYAGKWPLFFKNYESGISCTVPVKYTLPPFPVIALLPPLAAENSKLLPVEITELAANGLWLDMQPLLLDVLKSSNDPEVQKKISLTLAEVLLRNGSLTEADSKLSVLAKEYAEEPVGIYARFLQVLSRANHIEGYAASAELPDLEATIGQTSLLFPHLILSQIETALSAQQYKKAQQLLDRQDVIYPDVILPIKDLRQADTFVGLKEPLKAYVAYQLLKTPSIINSYPDSLKGYCDTLYTHKKYRESGECYTRLIPITEEKETLGILSFRKAMAELKITEGVPTVESFSLIEDAFPGSEAAVRAALKKTDLKYLQDKDWAEEAAQAYHQLAEMAVLRPLVAEALVKEALVFKLHDRNDKALKLIMQFLRDFQTSELRQTAQALLLEILPGEINALIKDGKYPEALILAKENKEVFLKNWLDIKILADLAFSYRQIGLYNHAREMYLYIMSVVKIDQREQYYLPLLQTVNEQGDLKLVEHLSGRYLNTYPKGKDSAEVLRIRINALIVEGQFAKAQELLPSPLPEGNTFQAIAAILAFHSDKYAETLAHLKNISEEDRSSDFELLFIYGESLYQTGDMSASEKAFDSLKDKNFHTEQVLYRLAQIEIGKGNTEKGLKLLRTIVEKGKDPLWQRYAAKDLEYVESTDRLQKKLD